MAIAYPIAESLPRMTFEEFLEWTDEDTFAEWVDGEITLMTTTTQHQIICGFLLRAVSEFVEAKDLGMVLFAPFLMRLSTRKSGREPDILFIAKANLDRLRGSWLDGPADLVVEVVSDESRKRDRETKFEEYAAAGVREYWLIDAPRQQADIFVLSADGHYVPAEVDEKGLLRSAVLEGLTLDVRWLWQDPKPTLKSVLAGWGLE
jgi:Uma2 family endonuclease